MNGIKYLLVFGLGAVVGSLFSAKLLDEKYSKIADEEIESVKEVTKKTIKELESKITELNKNKVEITYKGKEKIIPKVEVISEEEYFDSDRKKLTLAFFGIDKVLANDTGIIDNPTECIGEDIINNPENYFSECATIYVRNYNMNLDFEIIYYGDEKYAK